MIMSDNDRLSFYFSPIDLNRLQANRTISFDLYLNVETKYVLYKNRNILITKDDIQRLIDHNKNTLFIHNNDKKNFRTYTEQNLDSILQSDSVSIEKKAEVLYESAINVVEDVFDNPRSGDTIKRSREVIGHSVDFILTGPKAYVNLLKIRKHDYYTFTHSVNVCTFLISLAQNLGINDRKILFEIGEGGLLHDLGKSRIPSSIINKQGQLTNSEWEIMRQHPQLGVQIAVETRDITEVSLAIIGQHHERKSGKGYPNGLKGSELNLYANMASIVDVYDAMTTNRSYSKAREPMDAAKFLLSIREDFNEDILKRFIGILAVT